MAAPVTAPNSLPPSPPLAAIFTWQAFSFSAMAWASALASASALALALAWSFMVFTASAVASTARPLGMRKLRA